MEETKPVNSKLLPANAYRKLEPGEVYEPVVQAEDLRPEVTIWSIGLGVVMVVVFTAACAYMALRAGNAIEASIPIAIPAIFFGKMRQPVSTLLENVIIQSIGQAAGVVVDHDDQVAVRPLVRDLVDPDPTQTGQTINNTFDVVVDPGDDRVDRPIQPGSASR